MAMNTTQGRTETTTPGSGRLQEAATGLVDQAGRTAEAQASHTMTQAGDTLQQVAQAIREAGKGMRQEQPQIAGLADTAAQQVERSAEYLRQHDANEVINAATEFARRQPAVIVGGGLLIGLALGRFLRTASESASIGARSRTSAYGGYETVPYDRSLTTSTYYAAAPSAGSTKPTETATATTRTRSRSSESGRSSGGATTRRSTSSRTNRES